ncbi:MAG: leucine-rich repeat domain-containing protein [Bacteroidales bacterium]|nr:leucine-rich repeat domain-containing protein [Bacteroidales bacterium]
MNRKIYLHTLLFLLILGMGVKSFAALTFKVDGITYEYTSSTATTCKVNKVPTTTSGYLSIPSSVFCTNLGKSLTVTGLQTSSFKDCTLLTSISLPSTLTSVGNSVFSGCTNLTSISLPDEIESIGYSAFQNCSSLTTISLPKNLKTLGDQVFKGCTNLGRIEKTSSLTSDYFTQDGILFKKTNLTDRYLYFYPPNKEGEEYEVGQEWPGYSYDYIIVEGAFYGNRNLASLTFPKKCYKIGGTSSSSDTFKDTEKLQTVTINCTELSSTTYILTNSLRQLILGETAESVKVQCNGTNLSSLIMGANVTTTGDIGGDSMRKLLLLPSTPPTGIKNFSVQYTLKDNITYVPNNSYETYSSKLGDIRILENIASYYDNGGVIYVPLSLGDRTCLALDCYYTPQIENIYIPTESSYREIDFTITELAPYTLYNNPNIKTIHIDKTNASVGDNFAQNCTNLESIIVDNRGNIGSYAFESCNSLTACAIGDNVASIGKYAFANDTKLATVEIGQSVSSIGEYAFSNCSNLKDLYSFNPTPPTCESYALSSIDKWSCVLHVPANSLDLYKKANGWKEFLYIETLSIAGITMDENEENRYFNLQGTEVMNPQVGTICIKVTGSKAQKVIIK